MVNKDCEFCGEEKKGNIYKKTCGKKECIINLKKRTNYQKQLIWRNPFILGKQ
jgi:hypothetical protein